jgi:endonuclease YncB( thermonuclease family)
MKTGLFTARKFQQTAQQALLLSALLFPFHDLSRAASLAGQVFSVHSGDQITMSISTDQFRKIQLLGIDAPPLNTDQGRHSRKYLKMLLAGKFVTVIYNRLNQQGVILGRVFHGGVDMNKRMIEAGKARFHPHAGMDKQITDSYVAAQESSQQKSLGMWGKNN